MKLKACAKINLTLKVFPKKKGDTKHKIQSLITIYKHIYDDIFIKPNEELDVTYFVNNTQIKIPNDIVTKSIKWLQQKFKIKQNYQVKIIKNIPLASGLGGSSTDGATVFKYICKHQNIDVNKVDFKDIALNLSSDMPFFIKGYHAAIISNYGDKVIKYIKPLPKFSVILTNTHFNTKQVYRQWDQLFDNKSKPFGVKTFYNDLQPIVLRNKLLNSLFNRLQAKHKHIMISGSGGSIIQFD